MLTSDPGASGVVAVFGRLILALVCVTSGSVGFAFGHRIQADLVTGGLHSLMCLVVGLRWVWQKRQTSPSVSTFGLTWQGHMSFVERDLRPR